MKQEAKYNISGKIALIDADLLDHGTRHPNLVIMKLSKYFKEKGNDVVLIERIEDLIHDNYAGVHEFGAIYISKVFDFTQIDKELLNFPNVFHGGTGFYQNGGKDLPYEIEHHMPDYHVYDHFIEQDIIHGNKASYWKDYLDFSIGFATRGCFRKCEFCVNRKYDRCEFHSHIKEWLDPSRKKIYLWDDNIFAYSGWKTVFEELIEIGKPFQFRQGLDIRLLTDDKAKVLSTVKYYGDIIFAFDHLKDKALIEKKLKLWRNYTNKSTKLYVLAGFESQDELEVESVFERISVIIKYGCLPYVMRHLDYLNSPYKGMFVQIARWCNQPQFLKKKSFREFCETNQAYVKTEGKICASMLALKEFENKFPIIAKKYFDMRFDKQPYVINQRKIK
jgi:hypothetical protein